MHLRIGHRYNGPPDSGNGGYVCGLVAEHFGAPTEVTLRKPPPLEKDLLLAVESDSLEVFDGDTLIAEARPRTKARPEPYFISIAEAREASKLYKGFERHAFPTCYGCGPLREPGDGLRIFPGKVSEELYAAPWVPTEDSTPTLWSALDCSGGHCAIETHWPEGVAVLGRMTVWQDSEVVPGDSHIVTAWDLGSDGRKAISGTAVHRQDGEVIAVALSTWVKLNP